MGEAVPIGAGSEEAASITGVFFVAQAGGDSEHAQGDTYEQSVGGALRRVLRG